MSFTKGQEKKTDKMKVIILMKEAWLAVRRARNPEVLTRDAKSAECRRIMGGYWHLV